MQVMHEVELKQAEQGETQALHVNVSTSAKVPLGQVELLTQEWFKTNNEVLVCIQEVHLSILREQVRQGDWHVKH